KPNVFKDSLCKLFVNSQKITILPPIEAQHPPVAVINAPMLFGECQNLTLESASYGFGSLKYKWEHLIDTRYQYSEKIANLLNNLSNTTTSVTISSDYFENGKY